MITLIQKFNGTFSVSAQTQSMWVQVTVTGKTMVVL